LLTGFFAFLHHSVPLAGGLRGWNKEIWILKQAKTNRLTPLMIAKTDKNRKPIQKADNKYAGKFSICKKE
jgi:hypothetical protein